MKEPITSDFDFDAHIANLIAKSECTMQSNVSPRGWNNDNSNNMEDDEDEEGEFDSDWEDEGEDGDQAVLSTRSAEQDGGDTEHFDKLLGEYDDEDIGGLSDVSMMHSVRYYIY